MLFRQRPVTAMQLDRAVTVGMSECGVDGQPGDWLVIDQAGQIHVYRHAHFVQVFEPEDAEARELWRQLPLEFLGEHAG